MKFVSRLAIFLAVFPAVDAARAQQGRFGVGFQQNMSRFIPPPRLLSKQLRDAQEAIADEQYNDAIVILGDLLEREIGPGDDPSVAGQDFFLEVNEGNQQRLEVSLLRRCRSLIASLPPEALETYELRYGALADQALQQATERGDWTQLREVRRKYFHTRAGYQASALLAQRALYTGHPLQASLLLDDVTVHPRAATQLGDGVLALHAVALRLAGRSLPAHLTSSELEVADASGQRQTLPDDLRRWVDQQYAVSENDAISRSSDYPLLGATPSRNETAEGQLPISTPRWMLETTATPLDEQRLRRKTEELAGSGQLIPPSWTPIRVGDQLLMRTTERIRGVDYKTGKRVWQYPPWGETGESLESDQSLSPNRSDEPTDRLNRRVWNDVPYGQITSDGERAYLLDDLSTYRVLQISPLMGIRDTSSADGGRNTLVALELETEGKLLWRLGQNPTLESELNEAFFLGAPLAVDGALYCMVELAGDLLLVCLDPATGELRWRQQLVAIEGAGIQFDPIRRIAGATPSYHEGVLICPTGAGATVAVDLADRMLRWGHSYARRASARNVFNARQAMRDNDQMLDRWHHPAAIASGTSVLVTPVATDNLFCFELIDGKQRFSKARQSAFYVAGVRDGQLLTVSPREVVSYDLQTGRLNWSTEQRFVPPGAQIVGRGVFGPDSYIVPTNGNQLIKLSLQDGSVIERRTTRYPLGNLIAVDGEIISQSPTRLAVALGARTLGPRVERMLAEDPNNLDALIQKALLLIEQEKRQEALAVLERARKIDPDSDDVLLLSITSMLGELRDNPSPPPGLEEELDVLIDTPAQRLEFLGLRIRSALRQEQVEAAMQRLIQFSEVMVDVSLMGNEDDSILRDPARDCTLESWVAARAADVVRLAKEQDKTELLEERMAEYLESKSDATTKSLRAIASQLHPFGVDDVLVTLAGRNLDEGEWFDAERTLLGPAPPAGLLNLSELPFTPERALALAEVYQKGMMQRDTAGVAQSVLERAASPEGPSLRERALELRDQANATLAGQPELDPTSEVTLDWQSQPMIGGARRSASQSVVAPAIEAGRTFQGWSIVNHSGSVVFRDPLGDLIPLPMDEFRARRSSDRKAKISGGLLILERPGRIAAIDLFAMQTGRRGDALLWSREFGADGESVTKRQTETTIFGDSNFSYPVNSDAADAISEFRVGPLLGDRLVVLYAGDLMAIDVRSGETLWRNSAAPKVGHLIVSGSRIAVVSYLTGIVSDVTVFDLLDGRKLDAFPWAHGEVWATSGQHVLTYSKHDDGSGATVRLVDPFNGEVKLEEQEALIKSPRKRDVGRGTGRILQDRYMVLFDSTGRLVIWDLLRGRKVCRQTVDAMPELISMHALWKEGQILVVPSNEVARQKGDMLTQEGESHRTAHRILAVSTASGELEWSKTFEQPWGVTVTQPAGVPVLFLARSQTTYTINRSIPKMDVAMLRLSDGEIIHQELQRQVSPRSTGLTTHVDAEPRIDRITVQIEGERLQYRFGKQ